MFSIIFSLRLFCLAIGVVFVALPSSDGADNWFKTCSSLLFSCGNLTNIGYPFWGDGRSKNCGHPALQLQCLDSQNDRYPILNIGPKDLTPYLIANISFFGRNTTIKLQGAPATPCVSYGEDFGDVLQFSKSIEMINLLYNCINPIVPHRSDGPNGSITCYQNQKSFQVYYRRNMSSHDKNASCSSGVAPVFKYQLDRYNNHELNISDVVRQGFEVHFDYSSDCIKCKRSGCLCGSSPGSNFRCFCKSGKQRLIFGIAISGGVIILAALCVCLCFYKIPKFHSPVWCLGKRTSPIKFGAFWKSEALTCPNVDAFLQIYGSFALTRHTYTNIKKMTNGFRDKLGEGGYATVFKGMLTNGRLVAVKMLKNSKGNGEDFLNEVASLSRTNHVNIMSLLGFCFEGDIRALIYEYMPNGSLEKFASHGAANSSLPWETLFSIAIGIAKGLDYLHRGCNARILHFDIKPHNILLDEDFSPKISDFGLARLCPLQESTISMLEAKGTIGYIAPEVFCRTFGRVSHKSDVYSFGMMVLDMVCGRKSLSNDQQTSSDFYFPKWIHDQLELQDEAAFHGTTNDEEKSLQRKMILVSLWCIQTYPSNRPSMNTVVEMLQGHVESIQMPPKADLSSPPRLTFECSGTLALD